MQKKQWIIFSIVVMACGAFAYKYFDQAIPFIKVAITMDYDQACSKAQEIVRSNNWDFKDYHVVAKYTESSKLQAFVELEAGGKAAFIEMIEKDYFQPYAWHVRLFKEKEVSELIIAFTPDGKAYEFAMKLPETLKGAALSKDQAHKIARQGAVAWNVDLNFYELVESNCEELSSGRVDHVFTYQRSDVALGKGFYRIKLKVSGDVLSEMQRMVKIPDEFDRRYEQMFSLNHTIASFARNVGFILYFFILGLFIFVFFFRQKNGFLWKPSLKILGFFLVVFVANAINECSLLWNCYPTHMPIFGFMLQNLIEISGSIVFLLVLIGSSLILSESAGRLIFQKHIQFFKLLNRSVLGTYEVLTQVILGYGFAIIMLGYAVAFSLWTQTLGWWVPLSNLMDPNILATKVPAWCPIANAFRAGFMEELVCRALPIAGIALLARNSKRKIYWVIAMFVVQAVIFGALHANYPQQPAYYRIVELLFCSTGFGVLYIYFGLLPGIVAHFVFDAFLMSLPIFVSTLLMQKVFSILLMLIPLILIFIAWVVQGYRFKNVSTLYRNKSLESDVSRIHHTKVDRQTGSFISNRMRFAAYLFGVLGLLFWSQSTKFEIQTSKITVNVSEVERIATQAIQNYFKPLDAAWKMSKEYMNPQNSLGSKFIWQIFGDDVYQKLQGNYLLSPAYSIKFKKFEGAVEDRSEMFEAIVQADGTVACLKHVFPEFWAGADLSEEQAQKLAYDWILKIYQIDAHDTQIVVSQSIKHEHRRDWNIVVKDVKNYTHDQGQARIQVQLCGDQLSMIMRSVQPTEQWQRDEQSRMAQDTLLKIILCIVLLLMYAIFMGMAIGRFGIARSYVMPFILLTFSLVILGFIALANTWFEVFSNFSTKQPLWNQIFNLIGNSLIQFLIKGSVLSVLIMSSIYFGIKGQSKKLSLALPLGIALGIGFFGIALFFQNFEPMFAPNSAFNELTVNVSSVLGIFMYLVRQTILSVIILMTVFTMSNKFAYSCWLQMLVFVGTSVVLSSNAQLFDISAWIVPSLLLGLIWYWIYIHFLNRDSDLTWIVVATGQIMQIIPSVCYQAYPGILSEVILASLLLLSFVIFIYKKF